MPRTDPEGDTQMPGYDPARAAEIRPRLTLHYNDRPFEYENGQLRRLSRVSFPADAGAAWIGHKGLTPAALALAAEIYAADDLACRREEEVKRRANNDRRISVIGDRARRADPAGVEPLLPTLTPAERAHLNRDRLASLMADVEAGAAHRPGHAQRLVARALTVAPPSLVAAVAAELRAQAVIEAENRVAADAILAAIITAVAATLVGAELPADHLLTPARWGRRLNP